MDLLLTPANPAFPTDDAPYLAGDRQWERGCFLTYADSCQLSTIASLATLPSEELHGFLQTWLFFGLLSEALGLNEQEGGKHIVDPSQAKAELEHLYKESIVVKEDGRRYITGAKAFALGTLMKERMRAAAKIVGGIGPRLMYLDDCLRLAFQRIFAANITDRLDYNIKYSLAALGELLSTAVSRAKTSAQIPQAPQAISYPWSRQYLVAGGWLEGQMLAHGWCLSEIEKARTQFLGLNTMHYVSRLKKLGPWRDHSRCHKYRCSAFQIRMDGYQPAHAAQCRGCDPLDVDIDGVMNVLEKTQSFPVLTGETTWNELYERDEAQVEAFEPDKPYVAISHVWADGLGNPTANALPRCQVERVINLISKFHMTVDSGRGERSPAPYRAWIDTLCCPVDWDGKSIALERIADVYRKAAHILVLDASFTSYPSEAVDPAELLFRAVSCSAWMRRLWTFQEGALPRSLFYQFADRAVTSDVLFPKLYEASSKDVRYFRLCMDLWNELSTFAKFAPHKEPGTLAHMLDPGQQPQDILLKLQWALNFRSLSVPKDEPLCIATLLGFKIGLVAKEDGEHAAQKRMAMVWGMLAKRLGGIPPRLIFYVENPLNIEGFRWAPRSLLAADVQQSTVDDASDPYAERPFFESALDLNHRTIRFEWGPDTKLSQLISEGENKGLRGSYRGFRVYSRPYPGVTTAPEQYRLHSWDGVLANNIEDRLLAKEEETGRWFVIAEYHRSLKLATWTDEERATWDRTAGTPLCKAMHTGRCAMIRDNARDSVMGNRQNSEVCLMVIVEQEDETELVVRRQFSVILSEATEADTIVAETMTELAAELASEQVTADFIAVQDQIGSDEYASVKKRLRERMIELVAEEARPDFVDAAKESESQDIQEYMWACLAKRFSHQIILERTPDDQLWLVD
ncbi:hypothetical protein VP1G_09897 [Cytospora mali]|uniref:Heterokaryon incompatibility domain-containing protein n=1 Tax=Cytospora mali TaxID=578113 RepID=A0A194VFX3_CYTMA|nr:hypothetical protein VP1G_09897 [Valsa mali var. pyri (nom. inval.)]